MGKTSEKMRKTGMKEEVYNVVQKSESRALINFSLCGTTYPDKNYKIIRRGSRIACIEYVEDGQGYVNIDGKSFVAGAGDSYFLMRGRDQYYYSDSERPWKKHFINLSGKLLDSLVEGYGLGEISYFEGLDLSKELGAIIEIGKSGAEDCTEELIAILNRMMYKMHHHVKGSDGRSGAAADMKDFLNTRITSRFKIEELCKHISKSESQTIRIFKNAYGVTPYTYILDKKISLAKKLLSDTNLTVKQISDKLCFADEYYFSNLFKKKVGVTPSAFRKSII
jgi:AraC-like DNA-binding protein